MADEEKREWTPEEGFREAERRIAVAIEENETYLDLSALSLARVPEQIGEIRTLTHLRLYDNKLSNFPEFLLRLAKLEDLALFKNQISALPKWFGRLTNLTTLSLGSNKLEMLPETVRELSQLEYLSLYNNEFKAVPTALRRLTSLQELDLCLNKLREIPEWIGELASLQVLDLSLNPLVGLPASLQELEHLRGLFLHKAPDLGLPDSILGPQWKDAPERRNDPKSILDYYFRTRLTEEQRPLREAKLILVGRGEVGKTSLVRRLVEGKFSQDEDRTQGIRITQWPLEVQPGERVRMHVWDFGGQEIMHATHQFFLTDRSVYLLVLDGRGGQQESETDYWLRLIGGFAPESPVIVVLNKIHKDPFDLNRRALQGKYPQIRAFVETDCEDGSGIGRLQEAIVAETDKLPDLRVPFPGAWFKVKETLAGSKKNFLEFDEYRELCTNEGEPDPGAQESLATHLHRLGVALNFRNDRRLRDKHVLNPHWVTEGIYKLLNSPRLTERKGELRLDDLQEELDAASYPQAMHQFLLDLMEKFELCFNFADSGRYLIPELLDPQQPAEADAFDRTTCLNFEYHYPVIPSGLLPRFVVRTHVLSGKYRWRSGVILEFEGNRALIRADREERRVYISITGPGAPGRRRALAMIREDFEAIHRDIQNLKPDEMVPLPDHSNITVPYRHLEIREKKNPDAVWEQVVSNDVKEYRVRDLLNGVDIGPRRQVDERERLLPMSERPLSVFYSYAHADAKARLRLDKHLAPLRRLGLITDWYDHDILPGDKWAEEIVAKVKEADIVLLLISPDFVDSDYCYENELTAALKGKAAVIPIRLKAVNAWDKLPLGKLNGLPASGKKPIQSWPKPDEAWAETAAGIERVAEELRKRRMSN